MLTLDQVLWGPLSMTQKMRYNISFEALRIHIPLNLEIPKSFLHDMQVVWPAMSTEKLISSFRRTLEKIK